MTTGLVLNSRFEMTVFLQDRTVPSTFYTNSMHVGARTSLWEPRDDQGRPDNAVPQQLHPMASARN